MWLLTDNEYYMRYKYSSLRRDKTNEVFQWMCNLIDKGISVCIYENMRPVNSLILLKL